MSEKVVARSLTIATKCGRKVVEHSLREEELVWSIGIEREWRGAVQCEQCVSTKQISQHPCERWKLKQVVKTKMRMFFCPQHLYTEYGR